MKPALNFLKTTITGGILFLVPVILVVAVFGKAFEISNAIVAPLAGWVRLDLVGGIRSSKLLAIALIVLFCFLAGLFARTALARKGIDLLESTVLSYIPGYEFMKGMGESILGIQEKQEYEVVFARIEDAWQIGFVTERIKGGRFAVFVPDSPHPWSGSLFFMTEDQIKPIDIPHTSALKCLRRLGAGSDSLLRDLLPVSEASRSGQCYKEALRERG
jgi:uncharacterized membrane protein